MQMTLKGLEHSQDTWLYCIMYKERFGTSMEMVLLVSVKVVQMSGEVVGLSGDGVWVSEVACKPGAQGGRQP